MGNCFFTVYHIKMQLELGCKKPVSKHNNKEKRIKQKLEPYEYTGQSDANPSANKYEHLHSVQVKDTKVAYA